MFYKILCAGAALSLAACSAETEISDKKADEGAGNALLPANIVITAGKAHLMDGNGAAENGGAVVEAICISDGRIVHVGDNASAQKCISEKTRIIDADGRLILPGLIDSHMHVLIGSISEQKVNLSLADTMPKLIAALEAIRDDNPGDGVIYTRGWQNHLFPPDGPHATMLDEIFGARPVIIASVDGHSTWFSSRAFELAGADADTPDPDPGVRFFERNPETGALSGTAREGAGGFIVDKLVSRKPADYRTALLRWLPRAAASGLTGAFDARMGRLDEEAGFDLLTDLEAEGALTMRLFASTTDRGGADDPAARLAQLQQRFRGELVKPVAVKLFADGVPEAHTAFLTDDYVDRPGDRGAPNMAPARMNALVLSAQEKGLSAHIHAIGGAAVTMSLDAIEAAQAKNGDKSPRHAIAHMDLVAPADIPRFAELGVIAQTSIHWATRDPSFDNIAGFVGVDVMEAAYPIRSLLNAGAVQSFGTDWPAGPYLSTFKPFIMIETAVTRRLPGARDAPARGGDEAITIAEAVAAMTQASAFQLGEEKNLGSLEVGKKADLIILDQDIFTIDPFNIHKTRSVLTMVNGVIVHDILTQGD